MMMRGVPLSAQRKQVPSLTNLADKVKSLELKTLEELKTFNNARNEEARRYFYLRKVWAEQRFLRKALEAANDYKDSERYKAIVDLVQRLHIIERKYVEELSKWGEVKQNSELKFIELRKELYKASGTFIETPETDIRALEMLKNEPEVRQVIKDIVEGFLYEPEGGIEVPTKEDSKSEDSVDDSVIEVASNETLDQYEDELSLDDLANVPLPSSTSSSSSDEVQSVETISD